MKVKKMIEVIMSWALKHGYMIDRIDIHLNYYIQEYVAHVSVIGGTTIHVTEDLEILTDEMYEERREMEGRIIWG